MRVVSLSGCCPIPAVPLLFGETQGRIVVSAAPDQVAAVRALADRHGVPCAEIGRVSGRDGRFRIRAGTSGVDLPVRDLVDAFFGAIPARMDTPADVPTA